MVIRNIPDDVFERFKARARASGKSTEQLARELIAERGHDATAHAWARIDQIRTQTRAANLATALQIMEETREERDSRPGLAGINDDR